MQISRTPCQTIETMGSYDQKTLFLTVATSALASLCLCYVNKPRHEPRHKQQNGAKLVTDVKGRDAVAHQHSSMSMQHTSVCCLTLATFAMIFRRIFAEPDWSGDGYATQCADGADVVLVRSFHDAGLGRQKIFTARSNLSQCLDASVVRSKLSRGEDFFFSEAVQQCQTAEKFLLYRRHIGSAHRQCRTEFGSIIAVRCGPVPCVRNQK